MKKMYIRGLLLICAALFFCSCHPIDIEKELKNGVKAAQDGDWKTALAKAELCLDNVPASADAAILKSLSLFTIEPGNAVSTENALDLIRRVTQEHPDRYDAWLVYGWILLNKNRVNEAIPLLRKAYDLSIRPENADKVTQVVQGAIHYILGRACLRNGLFNDAAKLLSQSVKRTPYNAWGSIYSDLGYIAYTQGKYKEALSWMEKARKLSPNDYVISLNMAILVDYLSFKNYNKESYKSYEKQRLNWYRFALSQIQKQRLITNSAKEQVYLDKLAASVKKRAKL